MPVNWKDPDAFTRLLAAMVAAQDMKLDYRKIATMYGNGASYDSIESRFRAIRKEAEVLKAEVDSGERSEAPAAGKAGKAGKGGKVEKAATSASAAGSKDKKGKGKKDKEEKEKVATGRVSKAKKGDAAKGKKDGDKGAKIKNEPESEAEGLMEDEEVEDETVLEAGNETFI